MPFPRALPLRAAPLWLAALTLVAQLAGCSWPPSIVVVVPVVPPGAATISVLVSSGDRPAQEYPSLDVSAFVGQPYRFGVHPPLGATGVFAVAAAAFDRSGCLINSAAGEIELGPADNDGFVYGRPERTLQLTLDPGPADYASNCLSQRPAVRSFLQNEDDPTLAIISGWGFAPGVSVSLDGVPASSVMRRDATYIEARFTIPPSPSGLRQSVLKVKNPDGSSTEKTVSVYSVTFASRSRNTYTLDATLEPTAIAVGDA